MWRREAACVYDVIIFHARAHVYVCRTAPSSALDAAIRGLPGMQTDFNFSVK